MIRNLSILTNFLNLLFLFISYTLCLLLYIRCVVDIDIVCRFRCVVCCICSRKARFTCFNVPMHFLILFFFIWIHVSIFVHPLTYAHLLFVLMVSDMWHIIFLRRFFLCMCNMYVVRSLVSKVYLMCVQNIWKNFFFCISSFYEVLYVSYAYKQRHGSHTWMFVFMKENRFWLFLIIIVIHSKCT